MDRFTVTNREFRRFVDATGYVLALVVLYRTGAHGPDLAPRGARA
jgi:formylglycine-generating enzyme required for sulfatase activity